MNCIFINMAAMAMQRIQRTTTLTADMEHQHITETQAEHALVLVTKELFWLTKRQGKAGE